MPEVRAGSETIDDQADDRPECLNHSDGAGSDSRKPGYPHGIDIAVQDGNRQRGWQVHLVVLKDKRNISEPFALLREIVDQLAQTLQVVSESLLLCVDNEYDSIGATENRDARLAIKRLSGNRVELEAKPIPVNRSDIDGKEIKK